MMRGLGVNGRHPRRCGEPRHSRQSRSMRALPPPSSFFLFQLLTFNFLPLPVRASNCPHLPSSIPFRFNYLQNALPATLLFSKQSILLRGVSPLHEEKMNSTTTNPSFTIETPALTSRDDSALPPASQASRPRTSREGRCQHLFPNGKRCRKFAPASRLGLCITHFEASAAIGAALQQDQSDFTDLSADLLPELSEFSAGTDIRQFLGRLLTLVTKGRISPRRASVLAYITNQLLHSHRAIFLETTPADDHPQVSFYIPRPHRDWPHPHPTP